MTTHEFSKPYLLLVILVFIGVILWSFINKTRLLVVAKGSALMIGVFTGMLTKFIVSFHEYAESFLDLNPRYYLAVLYSFHLFYELLHFDSHVFVRSWIQMIVLSITIFLITSIITGFFVTYTLVDIDVNVPLAVIFGAIVSHTSAFEISTHLESLPRMRHMQALLKGESVLTEPILIIIFTIGMMSNKTHQTKHLDYFLKFIQMLGGGIAVGVILGWFLVIMIKKYALDVPRLTLYTLLWPVMGYHIASEIGVCAPSTVIAIGWFAMVGKECLGSYISSQLMYFWEVTMKVVVYVILCIAGINLSERVIYKFEANDSLIFLVTFLMIYSSRIMALLIIAPVLNKIGYGLTIQEAIVVALTVTRGGSSLFLAWEMTLSKDKIVSHLGVHLFICVSLLLASTSFMSYCFYPWLFKTLGIHGVTAARRNNMNTCMKYINIKMEQFVSVLKMDKLLGDAKWPLVYEVCKLRHPYQQTTKFTDKENEIHDKETKVVMCPECLTEIPQQPSAAEMAEMMWECRMRILKSKKVSYSRQYENGILMINAFRTLNNAAETAMDTPEAIIKLDELFKMFKLNQETSSRKKRRHFKWLDITQKELKAPKVKYRRVCFRMVTHPFFDLVIYGIILTNSSLILYGEIERVSPYSTEWYILTSIDFVFFFIYVAEFIIKILGYSVRGICHDGFSMYFMSVWNIIDFLILQVVFLNTCYSFCLMFSSCYRMIHDYKIRTTFFFLRLVRLIRLVKIIGVAFRKMRQYKVTRVNNRNMLAYEIGKGYVAGDEGLEEMINQTVDNNKIREDCLERIKADKLAVTRQLGLVQKDLPWVANTVKTKQACMMVLSSVNDVVVELKASGWIDEFEYRRLTNSIMEKVAYVEQIKSVVQNTPKELFRETSWIGGDKHLANYLFTHVITKIFDAGDVICQEGEHSNGVYIVISGLLKLSYNPNHRALEEMKNYGKLPIVDFINNISYRDAFEEYITSGNSFGELAVLTKRRYDCSIFAETPVQAYVVSKEILSSAFNLFYDPVNGLESRMWKTVAVRIGPKILSTVQIFQSLSKSALLYLLAESFVPDINHYKILILPSIVEDILLIDGVTQDYHTNYFFKAPCFIPRNIQKLVLPRSSHFNFRVTTEPKLLLIPGGEVSHNDIMLQIDSNSEMTASAADMNIYYGAHNLKWANFKRQKQVSRKRQFTDYEKTSAKQDDQYTLKHSPSVSFITGDLLSDRSSTEQLDEEQ